MLEAGLSPCVSTANAAVIACCQSALAGCQDKRAVAAQRVEDLMVRLLARQRNGSTTGASALPPLADGPLERPFVPVVETFDALIRLFADLSDGLKVEEWLLHAGSCGLTPE